MFAVAYYTRLGHTRVLAEQLARELGAEPREIRGERDYGRLAMRFGALLNMHFPIKPMDLDFSRFELVVLCTPIWFGRPACPTRTFLRDARLQGKRLVIVLSTWGDDVRTATQQIERELAGKGAKVEFFLHVVTDDLPEDELHAAGQELAKRIAFRLSELKPDRPPVPVSPGMQQKAPVEAGAPLPH